MINKNVANYTDFLGKTNKKIVQAPGGSSTLSLAWGNEKIDYGPNRQIKNLRKQVYTSVQSAYRPQQSAYSHNYSYLQPEAASFNPYNNNYSQENSFSTNNNQIKNHSGLSVTSSYRKFQSQAGQSQKYENNSKFDSMDLKTPIKVMDFQEMTQSSNNNNLRTVVNQNYSQNSQRNSTQGKYPKTLAVKNEQLSDSKRFSDNNTKQIRGIKMPIKIGGQYGYGQIKNVKNNLNNNNQYNQNYQISSKYQQNLISGGYTNSHTNTNANNKNSYQARTQQIDLAVQQQSAMKTPISKRSNSVHNDGRSCIKMVSAPQDKLILGDNSYNFWKQDLKSTNYIKKSTVCKGNKDFFNQKNKNN